MAFFTLKMLFCHLNIIELSGNSDKNHEIIVCLTLLYRLYHDIDILLYGKKI